MSQSQVRLISGCVGLLATAMGIFMSFHLRRHWDASLAQLPDGLEKPVLAMELVRSDREIKNIVGDTCKENCAEMLWQQGWSADRLFIFAYTGFFLSLAWVIWISGSAPARAIAALLGLSALMAALFDWRENNGIEAALGTLATVTTENAQAIRDPALAKWGFVSASILLGSLAFIVRPVPSRFSQTLGWLAAGVAVVSGVAGILACLAGSARQIDLWSNGMGLAIVIGIVYLLTYTRYEIR